MDNHFGRFNAFEVREILRDAGISDRITDAGLLTLGLRRMRPNSQRQQVLDLYRTIHDVDEIHDALDGRVPRSSIRSILCRVDPHGPWRRRSRRRNAGRIL